MRRVLQTILFFLGISGYLLAKCAPDDAVVIGITGNWTLGGQQLMFGGCVPANDSVVGKGGTLVLSKNGHPVKLDCETTCGPDFNLKDEFGKDGSSVWSSLTAAIGPLFEKSVDRYVTAAARGLEPDFDESVVALTADQVDLAPALQEMSAGVYAVHLEPISRQSAALAGTVKWSGQGKADTKFTGLKAGLYRLIAVGTDGEPSGPEAWVLVSSAGKYESDSAAFAAAQKEVAAWPPQTDPRAPRAALRAYLEFLSTKG